MCELKIILMCEANLNLKTIYFTPPGNGRQVDIYLKQVVENFVSLYLWIIDEKL